MICRAVATSACTHCERLFGQSSGIFFHECVQCDLHTWPLRRMNQGDLGELGGRRGYRAYTGRERGHGDSLPRRTLVHAREQRKSVCWRASRGGEAAETPGGQLRGTRLRRLRREGSSLAKVRSFQDSALESTLCCNEPGSGQQLFSFDFLSDLCADRHDLGSRLQETGRESTFTKCRPRARNVTVETTV